jgi:hypothetical protein
VDGGGHQKGLMWNETRSFGSRCDASDRLCVDRGCAGQRTVTGNHDLLDIVTGVATPLATAIADRTRHDHPEDVYLRRRGCL